MAGKKVGKRIEEKKEKKKQENQLKLIVILMMVLVLFIGAFYIIAQELKKIFKRKALTPRP
jgi:flagellar basal body-associated protein FliL